MDPRYTKNTGQPWWSPTRAGVFRGLVHEWREMGCRCREQSMNMKLSFYVLTYPVPSCVVSCLKKIRYLVAIKGNGESPDSNKMYSGAAVSNKVDVMFLPLSSSYKHLKHCTTLTCSHGLGSDQKNEITEMSWSLLQRQECSHSQGAQSRAAAPHRKEPAEVTWYEQVQVYLPWPAHTLTVQDSTDSK